MTLLLISVALTSVSAGELRVAEDLDSARRLAEEQNLPLAVYIQHEDSRWCAQMERTTLANDRVIEVLNTNFVLLIISYRDAQEVPQFRGMHSMPTFAFFNRDLQRFGLISGYMDAREFRGKLRRVLQRANGGSESAPAASESTESAAPAEDPANSEAAA